MRRLFNRIPRSVRLLPVLALASLILFTFRAGELTRGIVIGGASVAIAAESEDESAGGEGHPPTEALDSRDREAGSFDVIAQFTDEEIELLQDLANRRETLVERENDLENRTRLLDAAEAQLDKRIVELERLRETIEGLVRQYDEQEEAELASVVKIYETMKPKDAARILSELEMKILLGIMERMNGRKTAPILAAMPAARAREVTAELARRKAVDLSGAGVGDG